MKIAYRAYFLVGTDGKVLWKIRDVLMSNDAIIAEIKKVLEAN